MVVAEDREICDSELTAEVADGREICHKQLKDCRRPRDLPQTADIAQSIS